MFFSVNLRDICAISLLHWGWVAALGGECSRSLSAFKPDVFSTWGSDDSAAPSLRRWLEDCNNGILVVGHDKDTAELVKQSLELRAPHVLVVHNLFQVVVPSEIVQQPGRGHQDRKVTDQQWIISRTPQPWESTSILRGVHYLVICSIWPGLCHNAQIIHFKLKIPTLASGTWISRIKFPKIDKVGIFLK